MSTPDTRPEAATAPDSAGLVVRARQALQGVTEGPWELRDEFVYPLSISARLGGIRPDDARFIAAARSLVPELVAEVERLRAELNRYELGETHCWCCDHYPGQPYDRVES